LLRDHLEKERALAGIAALMLVPLFTFLASRLNANTVMMPFWVAAQLFYLRARRNLGDADAILTGIFVALTFLGKYWGIYLVVGMTVTSLIGSGTARFWRSRAPFLMALSATAAVAPHVLWFVTERSQATRDFMGSSVMIAQPFGIALLGSLSYLAGSTAYVVMPLIFFILLQPTRAALSDILWPADRNRQQAHLLFILPLILPPLANLVFPHRLTALWTFPNWALLPVILFGSPLITVHPAGAARAGLVALSVAAAAVLVSPYVAYFQANSTLRLDERHFRQVAGEVMRLSHSPLIAGTKEIVQGLSFYLPKAMPISVPSSSDAAALVAIRASGMVIICSADDEACRSASTELEGSADRSVDVTFTRTFLGFTSPQASYHLTVISAAGTKDGMPNGSTQ
jgi:hypothetical protein